MPAKKRKSIPSDSDIGDDHPSPPNVKSSRRKPTTTNTTDDVAPPSKKCASTSNAAGREISDYVAKLVTPEYSVIQTANCQTYGRNGLFAKALPEKCTSCTARQSNLGTCRFVNLRAFRKHSRGKIDYADFAFRSNLEGATTKKGVVKKASGAGPTTAKTTKKAAPKPENLPTRRSTRSRVAVGKSAPVVVGGGSGSVVPVTTLEDDPTSDGKAGPSSVGGLATGPTSISDTSDIKSLPEELEVGTNNTSATKSTLEEVGEASDALVIKNTPTLSELKVEADYVLSLIAPTFAEQLRREKRHEFTHLGLPMEGKSLPGGARPLIRILSAPETRSLCDNCATSIYMGGYLCGCCGSELCLGCWEEWEPSATRGGVRSRFRRIDTCSRYRRHIRDSMVFMTRATEGEIAKLLERVEAHIPPAEKQAQETSDARADIESIPVCQPTWPNKKLGYLATPKTHHTAITLQQFQSLWRRGGIPLVLTGFLDRFKLSWDPQYFTRYHGSESCYVYDCDDGAVMETTVKNFFVNFANPDNMDSYKLKDWPPSADFSTTFPSLFEDFENALPFPSYTARKGALNLAAHFPEGYNAPDLGPKMYNAYPAPDFLPGAKESKPRAVKGTTNLHLDLTDAMNIMLFSAGGTSAPESATGPKEIPFCGAIWDIFPPSASVHLRAYLNSETYLAAHAHEGAQKQDDPIHRQLYYLTEVDLITLYEDHGVMSYRIYQEPGEAVFIPAGCAHQVRNRKSCVKVAVDFLTPENVKVCKGLVEEGRWMGEPFKGRDGQGKEDVLQLWACLGFAWEVFDKQSERGEHMVDPKGGDNMVVEGFVEVRDGKVGKQGKKGTPMSGVDKGADEQPARAEIEAKPLLDEGSIKEINAEPEA